MGRPGVSTPEVWGWPTLGGFGWAPRRRCTGASLCPVPSRGLRVRSATPGRVYSPPVVPAKGRLTVGAGSDKSCWRAALPGALPSPVPPGTLPQTAASPPAGRSRAGGGGGGAGAGRGGGTTAPRAARSRRDIMCGGSEVTCPAGPFVLSGAGSATGGGGGEARAHRTAPHRSAPRRTRPDPPGSSSRGTQRGGARCRLWVRGSGSGRGRGARGAADIPPPRRRVGGPRGGRGAPPRRGCGGGGGRARGRPGPLAAAVGTTCPRPCRAARGGRCGGARAGKGSW